MQMTIDSNTRISQLLQADRDLVINTLVRLNGKFSKLRNPVLRNLLVKRVTIADACKISDTPVSEFFKCMEQIGFRVAAKKEVARKLDTDAVFVEPLDYLELDVRPILAKDRDPLKEILASVRRLESNQGLKLINTFEPVPLIHLLAEKGFGHRVERKAPNLVITCFNAAGIAEDMTAIKPSRLPNGDAERFDQLLAGFSESQISYLDVRELEMPGPMVAILNRTPTLKKGEALFVYHKKVPVYLLPELEKQNLAYAIKTITTGDVRLLIYWK